MTTTVVRSSQVFEAAHVSEPDFVQTLGRWMSEAGAPAAEIGEMIRQVKEGIAELDFQPWVINNRSVGLQFVPPAGFLNLFEDVADTDVLGEVYLERTRHIELGFTPEHDDANPLSHLTDQIENRVALVAQQKSTLTDAEKRKGLIQIASLAVAAVDRLDRAQEVRTFSVDGFANEVEHS